MKNNRKKFLLALLIIFASFFVTSCGGGSGGGSGGSGSSGSSGNTVNLTTVTSSSYTAQNGDILTGTLPDGKYVSIESGVTAITLNNVQITNGSLAGIWCTSDVTITLVGSNTVTGSGNSSGIYISSGKTLTINGTGSLTVTGQDAAGIGNGYGIPGGNIIINNGNITANGGNNAPGIGLRTVSGSGSFGNITINGGTVHATKGSGASFDIDNGTGGSTITIASGTTTSTFRP